jgi:hypothetical protein
VDKLPPKLGVGGRSVGVPAVDGMAQVVFPHHVQTIHPPEYFHVSDNKRRAQPSADSPKTHMEPLVMTAARFPFVSTSSLIPCAGTARRLGMPSKKLRLRGVGREGKHEP